MNLHELHQHVQRFERNRKRSSNAAKLGEIMHGVGTCPRCHKHTGQVVEKGGGLAIRCPKCGDVAADYGAKNHG